MRSFSRLFYDGYFEEKMAEGHPSITTPRGSYRARRINSEPSCVAYHTRAESHAASRFSSSHAAASHYFSMGLSLFMAIPQGFSRSGLSRRIEASSPSSRPHGAPRSMKLVA